MAMYRCGAGGGEDIKFLAPDFSTTTDYKTDDVVLYNGSIYKFTADKAAGAWSTSVVTKTDLISVGDLNSNLGGKLLWTNPSPTSAFDAQTISLDLSEYSGVIVETTNSRGYIKRGDDAYFGYGYSSGGRPVSRNIQIVSEGVKFGGGFIDNTLNNNVLIPTKFWGVNLNLE